MPFSVDQFLEVFKNYNLSVDPLQVVFYFTGIIAFLLTFKKFTYSNKIIVSILSFLWLWMGIVYHIIFFSEINKAAYLFGVMFIAQGIIFAYIGIVREKLSFRFQPGIYGITGSMFIFFALVIYPVIGFLQGHIYPFSPTFGLPCPTTIFTFGILLLADKKMPAFILIIPFIWSIIGFTAAFFLGIYEDTGLLVTALISMFIILRRNKREYIK
jgi:hypothetical protein